jgi:hypothetical protein
MVQPGGNMNQETIQMIAQLRKHMVLSYEKADIKNPSAVMKEADFAKELETLIKSVDDILRPYVKFE